MSKYGSPKKENVKNLSETFNYETNNYKDAIDLAIDEVLSKKSKHTGPFVGKVIKTYDNKKTDNFFDDVLSMFGSSETKSFCKVHVYDLDFSLPQPILDNKNNAFDSIVVNSHELLYSIPSGIDAREGDHVLVDYTDLESRSNPVIIERLGDSDFRLTSKKKIAPNFDKCREIFLDGQSSGFDLERALEYIQEGFYDNIKNTAFGKFLIDRDILEEPTKPKDTKINECLIKTSQPFDNTPEEDDVIENLIFLEEEVIPRLLTDLVNDISPAFTTSSIYRSEEVNSSVGGRSNSSHKQGLGVDFTLNIDLSTFEKNAIYRRAAKYMKERRDIKYPFLKFVYTELDKNHIHISCYNTRKGESGPCQFAERDNPGAKSNT